MCKEKNCMKLAIYNYIREKKALYCYEHKKERMVDVKYQKKCLDCNKSSSYNYEGEKKRLYCNEHKKERMVNVKDKTCLDCKKRPVYNYEGEKNALYCSEHKKEIMVNVISKTCLDCNKIAIYNYEGKKNGLYCSEHKKEGMMNVTSKTCLDCNKIPTYNYEGEKNGMYCYDHKKEEMENVISKKCLDCKKQSVFNYESEKNGLYCYEHKKEIMVNVISKTCKSVWCSTQPSKNYDGFCLFCYMHLFPDKPITRNYKTKEYSVVHYVKEKFPDLTWIEDKKIKDGCSNKRPDLLLDLGYQILMIEIDENKHNAYNCSCDNKRTMELSQDVGHRPIIFIRFNPDSYMIKKSKITSCWDINKNGICVVKESKKDEWNKRLKKLEEWINYWINSNNTTDKIIETIHLFYDV